MTDKHFAHLVLPFGDNEYPFCLDFDAVNEWEKQNDRSLMETFNVMVRNRTALAADVRIFLLMALIGGGMTPIEATGKVKVYVENRPLAESQPTALAVIEAFLFGNDAYRGAK